MRSLVCLLTTFALYLPATAGSAQWLAKLAPSEPLAPTNYQWSIGNGPVPLPSAKTHLCLLTEISGKLEGYGEWAQLAIDSGAPGGPRYILRGGTMQSQLRAGATCVQKTKFVTQNAAPILELIGDWTKNGSCNTLRKDIAADRSHALFLSGIGGKFKGGGEKIETRRSAGGMGSVLIDACSGSVQASIASIGGLINAPNIYYRTQTSRVADSTSVSFVAHDSGPKTPDWPSWLPGGPGQDLSAKPPTASVQMIPIDEGLCGITLIRGKLQGYGEMVQIAPKKASDGRLWWFLSVSEKGDDADIWAAARCIARNQMPG